MYVAVLSAALIVSVIGLSALAVVRVQRLGAEGTNDLAAARFYARSAIEMGLHWIDSDANWRTNRPNGVWAADVPTGDGTFTLEGTDPDALALDNDPADPLVLTGIGVKGKARYKLQVTLASESQGLTCLEVSLHAGNDMIFDRPTTILGAQIISANNSVTATFSTINPDVEAVNSINGGSYTGATTTGITPREMPDPATAFDSYVTNGTAIDLLSLPASMDQTIRYLRRIVLSPNSNPHGPTNARGIYVIDCLGVSLIIEECRIVGTLVIRNGGGATGIFRPVNWNPAVANYPALMVEGNFLFKTLDAQLSEVSTGVNFNPVGTPYLGATDGVPDDVYPSIINGLVYVSGDASDNSSFTRTAVNGVLLIGNTLTLNPSSNNDPIYLDLTYDQKYYNNPPPGFGLPPTIVVSPGSWQQVVD
jgi:hypothetical protein